MPACEHLRNNRKAYFDLELSINSIGSWVYEYECSQLATTFFFNLNSFYFNLFNFHFIFPEGASINQV